MVTKAKAISNNYALRQVRKRREGKLVPRDVHLETTYHCNLKCYHCYLEPCLNKPQSGELSTNEMTRILRQLFETGVFYVTFSGGEPFCRPDIFKIMNYAREQGLFFGLKTNGTLITESVADRLKELNTVSVDISIYGAKPQTHETVTGVAGSFNKSIQAIRFLRERKIRVGVRTTIMKCNVEEHGEIENLAKQLGASFYPDPMIFPKVGRQPDSAADVRIDDDQLRTLIKMRNWASGEAVVTTANDLKRHLICGAGRSMCAISPQGEVFPCTLWRIPLGNLRKQTFKKIWHGEAASRIRAIQVNGESVCASCEVGSYCARCLAMVYIESGGISGPSSENCRLAYAIKGVRDEREQETLCKPHYRIRKG